MFIQEKKYISLWRAQQKICEAGLVKLSVRDNRVKVEYFLNDLPVYDGCQAKCMITYSIVQEDKRRAISEKYLGVYEEGQKEDVRSSEWEFKLYKRNPQYSFQVKSAAIVSRILSCELKLQGNYEIRAEGLEKGELLPEANREQEKNQRTVDKDRKKDLKAEVLHAAGMSDRMSNAENARETDKSEEKVKEAEMNDGVQYVEDLEFLQKSGGELAELYHNSFLLHGFYQYRHFILTKQFLGVPGNFYEREAIAAKMLGFPYFIEVEHVGQCKLDGELRRELPENGAFGYYLHMNRH